MRIYVGRVLKVHGIHGSLKIRPLTDRMDRFEAGSTLLLEKPGQSLIQVKTASIAPLGTDLVVTFHERPIPAYELDVSSYWLAVDEVTSCPPEANTYYHYQLINLRVFDRDQYVGTVRDLIFHSPYDYLVIEGEDGEHLLPFLSVYCREVDTERGVIRVDCPGGFWE